MQRMSNASLVARSIFAVFVATILTLSAAPIHAAPHQAPTDTPLATNIILFIGDGMDEHQITMARNYLYNSEGSFAMEEMPVRSSVRVKTLREDNPSHFRYVADSANTASTLATGFFTSKGRISTSAQKDIDQRTILEDAQAQHYRTGLVSTSSLTDATPAAFATHTAHRYCQSTSGMHFTNSTLSKTQQCARDLKKNGGPGSIAEQLAAANIDVLLGGGTDFFGQRLEVKESNHSTILDKALSHGHQLLSTKEALQTTQNKTKLLGLFAQIHLPVEWQGEHHRRAELIKTDDQGKAIFPQPFSCEKNPGHRDTPELAEMTTRAIEALSHNNDTGFFLMVEGASIDKQAHERNPCGQIGEIQAFDKAVSVGRQFAAQQANTLIIVTADHGHAGQIVPLPESYQTSSHALKVENYPTGYYAVLKTLPGELMAVNYATNSAPNSQWEMHTGINVPVFMEGPGLEQMPVLTDQRAINQLMRRHLKLH